MISTRAWRPGDRGTGRARRGRWRRNAGRGRGVAQRVVAAQKILRMGKIAVALILFVERPVPESAFGFAEPR